jgi:hypothetical protein
MKSFNLIIDVLSRRVEKLQLQKEAEVAMKVLLLSLCILGSACVWSKSSFAVSMSSGGFVLQNSLDTASSSPLRAPTQGVSSNDADGKLNNLRMLNPSGPSARLKRVTILQSTAVVPPCCSAQAHLSATPGDRRSKVLGTRLLAVPESVSLVMLGTSLLGIAALVRRRRLL